MNEKWTMKDVARVTGLSLHQVKRNEKKLGLVRLRHFNSRVFFDPEATKKALRDRGLID